MMVCLGLVSPNFLSDTFIEETNFRRPVVGSLQRFACTIPSLTEGESTIRLKAKARLETVYRSTIFATNLFITSTCQYAYCRNLLSFCLRKMLHLLDLPHVVNAYV